jgi:hypothetical protein
VADDACKVKTEVPDGSIHYAGRPAAKYCQIVPKSITEISGGPVDGDEEAEDDLLMCFH